MIKKLIYRSLSERNRMLVDFDWLRFKARHWGNRPKGELPNKLHLGCGRRKVTGFLNADIMGSDFDMDFGVGVLPLPSDHFEAIVSQEVIEHLELTQELIPLLRELKRILKSGGELWLSCPDMQKVCANYMKDKGVALLEDRKKRIPDFDLGDMPVQHIINHLFHQDGEHKNLYDFELLEWAIKKAGFSDIKEIDEATLLKRFPEFPPRNDGFVCMYVKAVKR
ncbi:MAG: methyltransferase domain-containing protein [Flavobacteriales bacterium]|nr:methyltransferase domain-containing protein [Flavobacteriales bacterium]